MIYFSRVHCVSSKNKEITTYIIFDQNQQQLNEDILRENQQFKEFMHDYKPKIVYVDYAVYYTDEALNNSMQPETFENIISMNSTYYSQGELTITSNKVVKKKKTSVGTIIFISCICALIAGFAGLVGGKFIFGRIQAAPSEEVEAAHTNEDGMIVPQQIALEPDAEQITVSIDRSYSAIPTEDLELKGAIVDGKAAITLPEFDKTDFFTHVSGYTWGFTSVPDGKKIEYYGGQTYDFTENKKLYRVLVKYGGGSGTKEDPYLIDYYDQLELMASEEARGYFKQVKDISFPEYASHTPINTVNELKSDPDSERFEYDGNGFVIDNLDNPLFGEISGATIKNVNLRNVVVESDLYKDYGAIVCNAYNYQYRTDNNLYQTGETLIKHCSVAHASIIIGAEPEEETTEVATGEVVPPDLIEYDENGKVIEHDEKDKKEKAEPTKMAQGYSIGGISGNGGQIEDCYVEDMGITVNADDYILNVGGISGKPANVINSVVFNYSANGNIFNAGGIVGSAAGSRMYDAKGRELPDYYGGNIQGCAARMVWFNNEVAAGGIAAVGGSDAENPIISNCYAMEMYFNCGEYSKDKKTLMKEGICGGIIGTEGAFKNGHTVTNTVSVADKLVIGKKIKSKYDETVRQAPDYAFYQGNIITVINSPTVNPDDPKEIFTGIFKFDSSDVFGDKEKGALSYPENIEDLFSKTIMEVNANG
ncbi:ZmpA/ZmpB/ZmpC family metallo-endopeptidase-related protein [Ruminococcus sp.]|uniref:ZmpA/ZmpB/ZmpC family metallo-endopeptidase-related protein n=1 Tax=Ruminococcus sp. TaxID=41978 RepID=UPI0025FA4E4C|nr:ZmpA/ZmpB/ZmpC family metallo-endopeptidase-related protein [Ruminococcus sp.]